MTDTRINGDWLAHPGTQGVLTRLEAAGHQALAVGGCVRDDLLGVPVSDIDIATSATPEQMQAVFADHKTIPTGIEHGTLTVIAHGLPHEVTTFRRDVETDGRHAQVAFGTSLVQDAARRDFTMNALYADARGAVVDPLGGLPDLNARRVRFIGAPEDRIREDYLRILRFFRFTAHYGHAIDAEGLAACAALQDGLDGLSRERVGHEMRKLLGAADPGPAVAAMAQAGILARVIPGADAVALPVLVHLEDGAAPDWIRRLACLSAGGGINRDLRLSRAEARDFQTLAKAAREGETPFTLGDLLGLERGRDALLIRGALMGQAQDMSGLEAGATMQFPLKASDLAPLKGPQLGTALTAARARWRASCGTLDARALLATLDTPEE